MPLKISVITVVYNSVSTIEETLLSVAAQSYPDVEHIVIDGASTDGTVDIINQYRDKIAVFVSEPDHGIYDAMNKGLARATGDIVGLLNADDVYADDTVLTQVAHVFQAPAVDACHADLVYVDRNDPTKVVRYWKSRPYEHGLFEKGWMPAHPTFFVRRSVYQRLGGFDLQFRLQADFDLTLRFLEINRIRSVYIPKIFVRMRMGGTTNASLGNVIRGNIEAYLACKKNGLSVTPFFVVRKIFSRIPQFFAKPAA